MTRHGMTPYIFPAILSRNDTHDRPEREWSKDVWRTTSPLPSATSKVVVVFSDTNTSASASASASAYLADIIRDNLAKQNVVIQVVCDIAAAAAAAADVSLSTHHFIKHQPSAGTPLFFPRVDECYYMPNTQMTPTSYDILRDVSCIIDLWNSHEEMVLNVIKSGDDRDAENANDNDDDDESGTEGFDDDDDGDCRRRRPYQIDYAKIIEEYYHSKLSHTPRRLVIMF
jgi:hypothetical protein